MKSLLVLCLFLSLGAHAQVKTYVSTIQNPEDRFHSYSEVEELPYFGWRDCSDLDQPETKDLANAINRQVIHSCVGDLARGAEGDITSAAVQAELEKLKKDYAEILEGNISQFAEYGADVNVAKCEANITITLVASVKPSHGYRTSVSAVVAMKVGGKSVNSEDVIKYYGQGTSYDHLGAIAQMRKELQVILVNNRKAAADALVPQETDEDEWH